MEEMNKEHIQKMAKARLALKMALDALGEDEKSDTLEYKHEEAPKMKMAAKNQLMKNEDFSSDEKEQMKPKQKGVKHG